jgi:hypothetical protein
MITYASQILKADPLHPSASAGLCMGVPHHLLCFWNQDHFRCGGSVRMKKLLNIALLVSFVVTVMVPLTGVHIHKLASVIFLLLSIVHTITYRKKLGAKRWLLLGLTIISFTTGLFGMILDQLPMVLILHRTISIALVFFLAIHIFVFYKKLH